jgi:hypothetical protein
MYRLSASLFVLLATASVPGQAVSQTSSPLDQSLATTPAAHSEGCPVGFWAKRPSGLRVLRASDSGQYGPALGLDITLDHRSAPEIESVEVTVHGVRPRAQTLPTGVSPSYEVSKTFQLHRSKGNEGLRDASVWMDQVGALTRIDLKSITYRNGSTWHDSPTIRCEAVPSVLVLIGSR